MSKSANYCYAHLSQDTGLLLLAEVAAAPFNELTHAAYDADVSCKAKSALCVSIGPLFMCSLADFDAYTSMCCDIGPPREWVASNQGRGKTAVRPSMTRS